MTDRTKNILWSMAFSISAILLLTPKVFLGVCFLYFAGRFYKKVK